GPGAGLVSLVRLAPGVELQDLQIAADGAANRPEPRPPRRPGAAVPPVEVIGRRPPLLIRAPLALGRLGAVFTRGIDVEAVIEGVRRLGPNGHAHGSSASSGWSRVSTAGPLPPMPSRRRASRTGGGRRA